MLLDQQATCQGHPGIGHYTWMFRHMRTVIYLQMISWSIDYKREIQPVYYALIDLQSEFKDICPDHEVFTSTFVYGSGYRKKNQQVATNQDN